MARAQHILGQFRSLPRDNIVCLAEALPSICPRFRRARRRHSHNSTALRERISSDLARRVVASRIATDLLKPSGRNLFHLSLLDTHRSGMDTLASSRSAPRTLPNRRRPTSSFCHLPTSASLRPGRSFFHSVSALPLGRLSRRCSRQFFSASEILISFGVQFLFYFICFH